MPTWPRKTSLPPASVLGRCTAHRHQGGFNPLDEYNLFSISGNAVIVSAIKDVGSNPTTGTRLLKAAEGMLLRSTLNHHLCTCFNELFRTGSRQRRFTHLRAHNWSKLKYAFITKISKHRYKAVSLQHSQSELLPCQEPDQQGLPLRARQSRKIVSSSSLPPNLESPCWSSDNSLANRFAIFSMW